MRTKILVGVALMLLLSGCGGAAQPKPQGEQPAAQPPAQQEPNKQEPSKQPAQPDGAKPKSYAKPPEMVIDPAKSYTAVMETSLGTLTIELFAKDAPVTTNNFIFLARDGFYDGLTFHRIIKDFMIQGGDPLGNGTGSPGYRFADELPPKQPYTRGILAMANAGPNTQGSQFFICTGENCGGLDQAPNYTQFGRVVEGLDVLAKLEGVEVTQGPADRVPSKPKEPPTITKITIEEK